MRVKHFSTLMWRKSFNVPNKSFKKPTLNMYDHYLILDFECTCEKNTKIKNQEIIEFPCVWVDSNLNILSTFHRYVKPLHNPTLTSFCTELTGITQDMVEKEDTFDIVLLSFIEWYENVQKNFNEESKKIFVTCGNWDLKIMLPDQCKLSGIPVPGFMMQWLNLKNVFMESTGYYPKSLNDMCQQLGLGFIGRAHSGIDDCRNNLEIMRALRLKSSMPNTKSL
ncbi:ERI1 exoribonuclease 3-like isoform X1 [Homalodisca vitripennis]|uniref:ERI1 exoribonuclease 3-like isoform X1 n=1 Tax=Homalodisca vitripennis TaxID=197043 RepID=UPI001EEBF31F|nr:ERI1 exoribonuclease 3-like isoform X1 [Homalodisca vitripennis]